MSGERKYQVFVSSTFTDLQEARQELMQGLLALGMIPTGMELYPTEQNNQWPLIQKVINECDYYVVLLGGRYGTLSPMGLSYTHREFIYAATKKKPVIALLHDHPEFLPGEARETTREGEVRLADFRQLLQQKCLFRFWNSPADLGQVIRKAMPAVIKEHPTPGWVRAGQVTDMESQREVQELRRRIKELEEQLEEHTAGYRPPLDSLARGSDSVTLQYSCNVYVKGDCKVVMAESTMSWDQVFACVAPQMLHEVPEASIRQAVEEFLTVGALKDVQGQIPKAHAVRNVVLSTTSFNQIKIHLRALGLIRKSPRREGQTQIHWQLTPLGDRTMTEVLAQQKR